MIDHQLSFENISLQRKWFCSSAVDSCTLLKIKGPYNICDIGKEYTYRIHASGNCAHTIRVSDGVHIKVVTDSSLVVSFTQGGKETIKLSMAGTCIPLEDSINITVTAGSVDLVPNATICAADSVIFKLPAGFSGFDISPRSNISPFSTASQIVVRPSSTTTYTLSLFKNSGCGLFDTALVKVYPANTVNFGNDTTLCKGQSLTLSAADPAFIGYLWSNGSTSSQITIKDKGSLWVHAKDKYGCINSDTIEIKSIKELPVLSLTSDSIICSGKTLVLKAPSDMKKISWQDGSKGSSFTVTNGGRYWVTVTDSFQCSNSDTVTLQMIPAPGRFLTTDSAICRFDTITLSSSTAFEK